MGACADREMYFEKESVKELRAKMVIEYLKNNEADVKNTRSSSYRPSRKSEKVRISERRTNQFRGKKEILGDLQANDDPYQNLNDSLHLETLDFSAKKTSKAEIPLKKEEISVKKENNLGDTSKEGPEKLKPLNFSQNLLINSKSKETEDKIIENEENKIQEKPVLNTATLKFGQNLLSHLKPKDQHLPNSEPARVEIQEKPVLNTETLKFGQNLLNHLKPKVENENVIKPDPFTNEVKKDPILENKALSFGKNLLNHLNAKKSEDLGSAISEPRFIEKINKEEIKQPEPLSSNENKGAHFVQDSPSSINQFKSESEVEGISPGKSVFGSEVPVFNFNENSQSVLAKGKDQGPNVFSLNLQKSKTVIEKDVLQESGSSKNLSETNQNIDERLRESVNSYDLEKQAVGVSLPPLRPSMLGIVSGHSHMIPPSRAKTLVELNPFVDQESPSKLFKIQTPVITRALNTEKEPTFPTMIEEEVVINDYSNRKLSPRIDFAKPRFRSFTFQVIATETLTPSIPTNFEKSPVSNPFNMADSYLRNSQNIEVMAENDEKIIEFDQEEILIEGLPINEPQITSSEYQINNTEIAKFQELESSNAEMPQIQFSHKSPKISKSSQNRNGEDKVLNFSREGLSHKNGDFSEKTSPEHDLNLSDRDLPLYSSPANLIVTPELEIEVPKLGADFFTNFASQNSPILREERFSESSVHYNGGSSPDLSHYGSRISFPFAGAKPRERSLSPEYSVHDLSFKERSYNRSSVDDFVPTIKVFGEDNRERSHKDSVNIPDIRASLNNSGLFFKNKVHYLRNSPQKLPPELYQKNLKGKLTLEEELTLFSHENK